MKKYIATGFLALLLMTAMPVHAVTTTQMNTEAKAALIKELTLKLNELIMELNALIAGQDARIKMEVITSKSNAEIYYTTNFGQGYRGACADIQGRIYDSLRKSNLSDLLKSRTMLCFDSKEGYALSVQTSNEYYCADSTGFSGATTKVVYGTTCQ